MSNYRGQSRQVAEYLQSAVKLEAVDVVTKQLHMQLDDSQRIMNDIQLIFDAIPSTQSSRQAPSNTERHEDVSKFLDAEAPKLLMPDMVDLTADIDLDDVIATMKHYVEDLKKSVLVQATSEKFEQRNIEPLNLAQYACSLTQLSKRLANLKLGSRNETRTRNMELEAKLAQLCQDVNMFTQMVETKKALSECSVSSTSLEQDNNTVQYEEIITKLLSGINELTYILQNKQ